MNLPFFVRNIPERSLRLCGPQVLSALLARSSDSEAFVRFSVVEVGFLTECSSGSHFVVNNNHMISQYSIPLVMDISQLYVL